MLLATLQSGRNTSQPNPLYLHGPSGVGKSQLVHSLVTTLCQAGGHSTFVASAGDLQPVRSTEQAVEPEVWQHARDTDLWIVEDVQLLPVRSFDLLTNVLDCRIEHALPTVVTARVGPNQLCSREQRFPARLVTRLAGGLVMAMEPLQAASRLVFLEELAQARQFAVNPEILQWLAERLPGSGRVLEGAMHQLEVLAAGQRKHLELAQIARHFESEAEANSPTLERILRQVSGYFRLEPKSLQSRRRLRNILLPRQVSMYLARKLTQLSLDQIGAFFGGRDHSTVLHACRKVEDALENDPVLSGAVRQLHAQLA